MAVSQNLHDEVDVHVSLYRVGVCRALEFLHQVLRQVDILEHRSHLVDNIVAALDLKLIEHDLFGLIC